MPKTSPQSSSTRGTAFLNCRTSREDCSCRWAQLNNCSSKADNLQIKRVLRCAQDDKYLTSKPIVILRPSVVCEAEGPAVLGSAALQRCDWQPIKRRGGPPLPALFAGRVGFH